MCSLQCFSASLSLSDSHTYACKCVWRKDKLPVRMWGPAGGQWHLARSHNFLLKSSVSEFVCVCVCVCECMCVCVCVCVLVVHASVCNCPHPWLLWRLSEHTSFQRSHFIDCRKFFASIKEIWGSYCSGAFIHKLLNSGGPDEPE